MSITVEGQLTVFFEAPFWVGVFERIDQQGLSVYRVVFGSEPKDYEINRFINDNYYDFSFGSPVENFSVKRKRINPKRMQREVKRSIQEKGIETKAQEAIRLNREEHKLQRKKSAKEKRRIIEKELYEKKQNKKKQKKKGH